MWINSLIQSPEIYLPLTLIIMFSICCHEYAHAYIALQQGDPTAKNLGHLTLNPMVQMGPVSLVILFLIGVAWGSVPVIPRNFKSKWSDLYVTGAGPVANVILWIVFGVLAMLFWHFGAANFDQYKASIFFFILTYASMFNMVLALFNMAPIPPFDGFKIWQYVFPKLADLGDNKQYFWIGIIIWYMVFFRFLIIISSVLTKVMFTLFGIPFVLPMEVDIF